VGVLVGTLRLGRVHKGSPPGLPREYPFAFQKRQPLSNLISRNPEFVREKPFRDRYKSSYGGDHSEPSYSDYDCYHTC
jgi:hypothetical protein